MKACGSGGRRPGRSARSHARRAGGPVHDDDHRPGDGPAVPQQHHPADPFHAPRQARAEQELLVPAPNASAAQGNYHPVRTLPTERQSNHRADRSGSRHALGHGVRTVYASRLDDNRTTRHLTRDRRPCLRAGHEELAGVPHAAVPLQRRQPVPGGPCRRAGRPAWLPLPAGRCRRLRSDRGLHRPAGRAADYPAHRLRGLRPGTGGAVNDYRRATSRCGT